MNQLTEQQNKQAMMAQLIQAMNAPEQPPQPPAETEVEKLLKYANNGNSARLTIELKSRRVKGFGESLLKALVTLLCVAVGVPFLLFALYIVINGPK